MTSPFNFILNEDLAGRIRDILVDMPVLAQEITEKQLLENPYLLDQPVIFDMDKVPVEQMDIILSDIHPGVMLPWLLVCDHSRKGLTEHLASKPVLGLVDRSEISDATLKVLVRSMIRLAGQNQQSHSGSTQNQAENSHDSDLVQALSLRQEQLSDFGSMALSGANSSELFDLLVRELSDKDPNIHLAAVWAFDVLEKSLSLVSVSGEDYRPGNIMIGVTGTSAEHRTLLSGLNVSEVSETSFLTYFPDLARHVDTAACRVIPGEDHPLGILMVFPVRGVKLENSYLLHIQTLCNLMTLAYEGSRSVERLHELNEQLEDTINQRTGELVKSNEKLSREIEEKKKIENSLRSSEEYHRGLIEFAMDMVTIVDDEGLVRYQSPSVARDLGYALDEAQGKSALDIIHDDDVENVVSHFQRMIREPDYTPWLTFRVRHKKGHWIWIESLSRNLLDNQGVKGIVINSRDVTERRSLYQALRNIVEGTSRYVGKEFFRHLTEHLAEALLVDGSFIFGVDQQTNKLNLVSLWYQGENHESTDLEAFLNLRTRRGTELHIESDLCRMLPATWLSDNNLEGLMAVVLEDSRNERIGALGILHSQPLKITDHLKDVLGIFGGRAISELERIRVERDLIHSANYDSLTGLPNRVLFFHELNESLLRARDNPEYHFVLLFMDLDHFKVVNDSLGHLLGDELLVQAAKRLRKHAGKDAFLARLSGDEFAILLKRCDLPRAEEVAGILQNSFRQPFSLRGHRIHTSLSIGLAPGDHNYNSAEELLRDADTAMYRAKFAGRAGYRVFDRTMHEQIKHRFTLENQLQQALEEDQFEMFFQPIVFLKNCSLSGFESLVRWRHPELGLLTPGDFLEIFEEGGRIVDLDRWVFRNVVKILSGWQKKGINPGRVNINLSAFHLSKGDLAQYILGVLREFEVPGDMISLEITESTLMQTSGDVTGTLQYLRANGISITIDDFGIGYSSLSRLQSLPIDTLKVDRSFIEDMEPETDGLEMVWAIVSLAHNLGMNVVAEGVDGFDQVDLLNLMHCEKGQGYFFARPMEASAAEELINMKSTLPVKAAS